MYIRTPQSRLNILFIINAAFIFSFLSMSLVLIGHPLDTIKVRIQTMEVVPGQAPAYTGVLDCAKKIVAKEGFSGLYKGMAAPMYGVTPMYALCFLGFGHGKQIFCDADTFKDPNLSPKAVWQIGCAGAFSALYTTPILAPGERLKCYLQVQAAKGGSQFDGNLCLTLLIPMFLKMDANLNIFAASVLIIILGPMSLAKALYAEGGMKSLFRVYY